MQDVDWAVKLGQPATTFREEAQRIACRRMSKRPQAGRYIGRAHHGLHAADVEKLIMVLQRLGTKRGHRNNNEHNIDVKDRIMS